MRAGQEASFFWICERGRYVVRGGIETARDHYSLKCYDVEQVLGGQDVVEVYPLCLTGLEAEWIAYFSHLLYVTVGLLFCAQFVVFTHISQAGLGAKRKKP